MRRLLLFFLFTLNPPSMAEQNLVFASINHPTVVNYYEPLLRTIYAKIGVSIEYVYISGERSEISLESGLIDGALAYSEASLSNIKNIIVIKPPLTSVKQYLLCQYGLVCNRDVLEDPNNTIFMASVVNKTNNFEFKAKIETMTSISVLEKLFTHDRIKYMIYPFSRERNDVNILFPKAERFLMFEENGYHVLNIKHKALSAKVSQLLTKKLQD